MLSGSDRRDSAMPSLLDVLPVCVETWTVKEAGMSVFPTIAFKLSNCYQPILMLGSKISTMYRLHASSYMCVGVLDL